MRHKFDQTKLKAGYSPLRQNKSQTKSYDLDSLQILELPAVPQSIALSNRTSSSAVVLADADYEFLFDQLLQGVAHGWHQGQIVKFFARLEARGQQILWVRWLRRFQAKLSSIPPEYRQYIGTLMTSLAKSTRSTPEVRQIGAVAGEIGRQLLYNNQGDLIWEYDGADVVNVNSVAADGLKRDNLAVFKSKNSRQPLVFKREDWVAQKSSKLKVTDSKKKAIDTPSSNGSVCSDRQATLSQAKNLATIRKLIKDWFELGVRQANLGKFQDAIASWDRALELDSSLSEAWHNRGSALGHLGKYSEAIVSFERALVIDANNYRAWNGRAHALCLLQNWFEAASSWQKAIEIVPDNYLFWFNRACALERIKSFEESLVSYQKALEIKPDFQLARSKYLNLVRENFGTNWLR